MGQRTSWEKGKEIQKMGEGKRGTKDGGRDNKWQQGDPGKGDDKSGAFGPLHSGGSQLKKSLTKI